MVRLKPLRQILYWDYSLLVFTLFLIFIIPIFPEVETRQSLYSWTFTLLYLLGAMAMQGKRKYFLPLAGGVIVLEVLSGIFGLANVGQLAALLSLLLFIIIVIRFISGIAGSHVVNTKVIVDAINGYLLLGVVFAILVGLLIRFNPGAFSFSNDRMIEETGFVNNIYFSLVTITTLGYGDFLPLSPAAKSLATLISITGQFYVAIIVALIVGKFASRQRTPDSD